MENGVQCVTITGTWMKQIWCANSWDTMVLGLHTTNQERVWSRLKIPNAQAGNPHYWTVGLHRQLEAIHCVAMGEMLLWSAWHQQYIVRMVVL